ncbi:hypothetical protein [Helicobacter pylori]|uniref:hypothetical protein n=1 Tax=Helicobacter pylori TaxID=210 RepID=UPI00165B1B8E|nr:hypothetical protein [Helicobacter pylori]
MAKRKRSNPYKKRVQKKVQKFKNKEFKKESSKNKEFKNKEFKKESLKQREFKRNPQKRGLKKGVSQRGLSFSKRTHNSNTRYRACGI